MPEQCPYGHTIQLPPYDPERPQHPSIIAERARVSQDYISYPEQSLGVGNRFESYLYRKFGVARDEKLRSAAQYDLKRHAALALHAATMTHVYQDVAERRIEAIDNKQFPELARDSSLEEYQFANILKDHGPVLAATLATVNIHLQQAGGRVDERLSDPGNRYFRVYRDYSDKMSVSCDAWNEDQRRLHDRDPSYMPLIVPIDTLLGRFDNQDRRDNVYIALQALMPGVLALDAHTPRERTRLLLQNIGRIARQAELKLAQMPVTPVTCDSSPHQGTEQRLKELATGKMTLEESELRWGVSVLHDVRGPWNNRPYYEEGCPEAAGDVETDTKRRPFNSCTAQFPYWFPEPKISGRYWEAIERHYDIRLTKDPTGRIKMTHILLAEMAMMLEHAG